MDLSYRGVSVEESKFNTTDLGNGLYLMSYSGEFYGPLDLSVQRVGNTSSTPIFGSPFPIEFISGTPCPNDCSGNGYCQSGECVCAAGFTGSDCSETGAPFVTEASFSDVGVTIHVHFNGPTNRAGMRVIGNCNNIFTAATVSLFGQSSHCIWRSNTELVIVLGTQTQVDPGTPLTFADNSLLAQGGNSPPASGSFPVSLPENPVQPVLQIVGSSEISPCQTTVTFDARSSLGRAGREMTFEWGLLLPENPTRREELLHSLISEQTGPFVTFPASIFPFDTQNVITVTATNILNGTKIEYLPIYRGSIRTQQPTVLIQSPRLLRVQSSQSFSLSANTELPCGIGTTVSYAWSRADLDGPALLLNLPTSVTQSLYVPPYTFSSNAVFYLEVTVAVDGRSDMLARDRITVVVDPPQDYAQISFVTDVPETLAINSNRRRISRNSQLTLDASSSNFFDLNEGDFSFDWDCWTQSLCRCEFCLDEDGKELYIGTNNSQITFPATTFQPGEYAFVSRVTDKLGGVESAMVEVDFVASDVPEVYIAPLQMERVPAGVKLVLESTIFSLTARSPFLEWSVSPAELLDLDDFNVVATSRNAPLLILHPNTLFEHVTYTFRLSATDSITGTGFAEISFTVNSAPVAGTFDISPPSGVAGSTLFSLGSSGWEDPTFDLPLSYSFAYINRNGLEIPLGADPVPNNQQQVILPGGVQTVVAYIFDSWGASTRVESPVSLTQARKRQIDEGTIDQAKNYMEFLETAVNQQNQGDIIQYFSLVVDLLNDPADIPTNNQSILERQEIRHRLLQILDKNLVVGGSSTARSLIINFFHQTTFRSNELNVEGQSLAGAFLASRGASWSTVGLSTNDGDIQSLASLLAQVVSNLLSADQQDMSVEVRQQLSKDIINGLRLTSQAMLFDRSLVEAELIADGGDVVILTGRRASGSLPPDFVALDTTTLIPSVVSQQLLRQGITQVDYLYIAFKNNPYFHSESSADLHTGIALLEFLNNGEPVPMSGLTSPVEISLPTKDSWPYVLCQYFDETNDIWSPEGCQASDKSTPQSTVCLCDHLSVFSARAVPAPPLVEGPGASPQIPTLGVQEAQAFIIPWWLVLIVAAILLVIGGGVVTVRRTRKEYQYKPKDVDAIPSSYENVEAGIGDLHFDDEEVFMERNKLMEEESSVGTVGLRRPVLVPFESESEDESEIARRRKGEEESSSDDSEVKRTRAGLEEESSEEDEVERNKGNIMEESSEDEGEVQRRKATVEEESSEEEPAVARAKTNLREESSEDETPTNPEEGQSSDDAKDN